MGWLTQRVLAISDHEVSFAHRGFPGADQPARAHLEHVASGFLMGYRLALETDEPRALGERLSGLPDELLGFAFEGAAMAVSILDTLKPWRRRRLPAYLSGPAAPHIYLALVGVGWAAARLPVRLEKVLARVDATLGWLVLDGYGFHQVFFHGDETVKRQTVPARVKGYGKRAFDQGIGRCLWFYEGAHPERLAARIESFPTARQSDLWSGLGLACCYAGGTPEADLLRLRDAAGRFLPEMAQGVAFAAAARHLGGNPTAATALACRVFWNLSSEEVAALANDAGLGVKATATAPAYEVWRQRIQDRFRARDTRVLAAGSR